MADDADLRPGKCHCGTVRFEAALSDGFESIRRCTCSYCRMRALPSLWLCAGSRFCKAENALTSHRFHSGSAQHFFYSLCAICTHHQR